MVGSGVHYKFKEFTLDTLKTIITDKTLLIGSGTMGISFIEALPDWLRILALSSYCLYLWVKIYKKWKQ